MPAPLLSVIHKFFTLSLYNMTKSPLLFFRQCVILNPVSEERRDASMKEHNIRRNGDVDDLVFDQQTVIPSQR